MFLTLILLSSYISMSVRNIRVNGGVICPLWSAMFVLNLIVFYFLFSLGCCIFVSTNMCVHVRITTTKCSITSFTYASVYVYIDSISERVDRREVCSITTRIMYPSYFLSLSLALFFSHSFVYWLTLSSSSYSLHIRIPSISSNMNLSINVEVKKKNWFRSEIKTFLFCILASSSNQFQRWFKFSIIDSFIW